MESSPADAAYAALLAEIVDEDGLIRYSALDDQAARSRLDGIVADLAARTAPDESDRAARMALWINAFNVNALAMAHAARRQDGFTGVDAVAGFFDSTPITVAGEATTLGQLRDRLRSLDDPRVHAALCFAAMTAPPMRTEPYEAARLEAQLDDQALRWLDSRGHNRTTRRELLLSPIFETYTDDFAVEPYAGEVGFVRKHSRPGGSLRDFIRSIGEVKVVYMPYNWKLNQARELTMPAPTDPASAPAATPPAPGVTELPGE